jgi:uncharacterized RDD family membrane protein YckC
METIQDLRSRYGRLSDDALIALLAEESDHLTADQFRAVTDEVVRRGLRKVPPMQPMVSSGPMTYPKASLGRRFLAYLIDGAIAAGPVVVLGALAWTFAFRNRPGPIFLLPVAGMLWALYYGLTRDAREGGQSIGKGAMDLMVVNVATNRPCSMSESVIRNLVLGAVNVVPAVGWLIEPIIVLAEHAGRRLGDQAAGTQVIDARTYQPGASAMP